MKSLLSLISFCFLCAEALTCFQDYPLESNLQEYLALKKSCSDTLFPEPPCCGNSIAASSRIINGELTGLRELTWTVYLNYTHKLLGSETMCGGSLINSRWVLSAAHCFEKGFFKGEAHIGEWDLSTDPDCVKGFCAPKVKKIKIAQVIMHPEFKWEEVPPHNKQEVKNDLALLHLEEPVAYSEFINPICLPFKPLKKNCFENQKAIAAGWGSTDYRGGRPVKLQTTLTIWETDKCEQFESPIFDAFKDEYHICASAGRNYTCYGDSGGPFSLKLPNSDYNYLLAVVSGGSDTCDGTNHPAFFSRINIKWIADVILKTEAILQKSNK